MGRVVIPYKPRIHQREMHTGMESRRFSVVVAGRRGGKSVSLINHIIKKAALCKLERPRYAYIAPFYSQAKKIAWDYLLHYTAPIPGCKINESELWVQLPNGARIMLFGADNPKSLRGIYLDGVVLDEYADIRPDLWGEVLRPALSDRKGWAVFIGTPRGQNHFYSIYHEALANQDTWFSAIYPASKTGFPDDEELELARKDMSEAQYAQEYECSFAASNDDVLIPLDLMVAASNREVSPGNPIVWGLDPARFGDDDTCLARRHGDVVLPLESRHGKDTMQVAGWVASEYAGLKPKERPKAINIDVIGLGAGVFDRLKELNLPVVAVNVGEMASEKERFINLRAELWVAFRDWLRDRRGKLPEDQRLNAQATSVHYDHTSSGKLRIERKKDMKRRGLPSPDRADAVVLTFYGPVGDYDDGWSNFEQPDLAESYA